MISNNEENYVFKFVVDKNKEDEKNSSVKGMLIFFISNQRSFEFLIIS